MRRDLFFGIATVLVLCLSVVIFSAGSAGAPAQWAGCLIAMLLGGGVSLLAAGIAGRSPRLREVGVDAFVSACFAAAASTEPIWKAPVAWADLFHLSAFGAALFCTLYHAANVCSLAARRMHLGWLWGGVLLLLPFVFGCLLSLQPGALAERLGGLQGATHGFHAGGLATAGARVALLLLFNEFVVNALSLGMRRMLLPGWRARLCLLACSAGAVLAPVLADFGSSTSLVAGLPALRFPVVIAATALSQGLLWAEVFLLTGVMLDALRGAGPSWRTMARHGSRGLIYGSLFSGVFISLVLAGTPWRGRKWSGQGGRLIRFFF